MYIQTFVKTSLPMANGGKIATIYKNMLQTTQCI